MTTKLNFIRFVFLLIAVITSTTCIKEIDFEFEREAIGSVVIQGRIVKGDPSFVRVNLSLLTDFGVGSLPAIEVEELLLLDDRGNEIVLETDRPNSYFRVLDDDSAITPEVGVGYQIRATLADGRIIESEPDVLPPNQGPVDLGFLSGVELVFNGIGLSENEPRILLTVDSKFDKDRIGGLLWDVKNIYRVTDANFIRLNPADTPDPATPKICYITERTSSTKVNVLTADEVVSNEEFKGFELASIPITLNLAEGYFFEVRQFSLSDKATEYWFAVNQANEFQGGIFQSPIGVVRSNMINLNNPTEDVFGYFFATEELLSRKKVDKEFFGDLRPRCATASNLTRLGCINSLFPLDLLKCFNSADDPRCICGVCCDCLAAENSTEVRPDFWVD